MTDLLRRPGPAGVAAPAQALALCEELRSNPGAVTACGIVGPGGSGKTAALHAVARACATAGLPARRDFRAGLDERPQADHGRNAAVLLVDDAHALDDAALDRLREAAAAATHRIVVAYRTWPRSRALAALGAALAAHRAPLVLATLDEAQCAARISELLGEASPEPLTTLLHRQTVGRPRLLDALVLALREAGELDTDRLRHLAAAPRDALARTRLQVPAGLSEALRYELDTLPEAVRALLLAATLGAGRDTEALGGLLGVDAPGVSRAVEAARATGLVTEDGTIVPVVGRMLLRLVPASELNPMREQLAALHLARGGSVREAAGSLRGPGASGEALGRLFVAAGDETMTSSPRMAGDLFTAAVGAGAPPGPLSARRAHAAALTGRLDEALRFADAGLRSSVPADAGRAAGVSAAVLAARGLLSRSVELYRWAGVDRLGEHAEVAVPALIGTGALAEAEALAAGAGGAGRKEPTLLAGAESLMARGIRETVSGTPGTAVSALTRAATLLEPAAETVLLPDTPAALAAVVAAHIGEFDTAESVLLRALEHRLGGPAAAGRHTLLLATLAMLRGQAGAARRLTSSVTPRKGVLEPRDELFAAAVEVGTARRDGDLAALQSAWPRARASAVRHPVDLYVLLPLGELAVAAARLGESDRLAGHLRQADELLERLGEPALWAVPMRWSRLHAAITAQDPAAARREVAALAAAAGSGRYAAALAGAATSWLRVLAGTAEPGSVIAAARALAAAGLGPDGARLAGQAAARTTDRKAMAVLLECARECKPAVPETGVGAAHVPAGASAPHESTAGLGLSDREREVAGLVLAGLTYREIGERLYISGKTVEHHVARIRRRLGASTRRELLDRLRAGLSRE